MYYLNESSRLLTSYCTPAVGLESYLLRRKRLSTLAQDEASHLKMNAYATVLPVIMEPKPPCIIGTRGKWDR